MRLRPGPDLLLGPEGVPRCQFGPILTPVEGTPAGNAALALVAGLARLLAAGVLVLRVTSPARRSRTYSTRSTGWRRAWPAGASPPGAGLAPGGSRVRSSRSPIGSTPD